MDGGAIALHAFNPKAATVLFNKFLAEHQSQAGARFSFRTPAVCIAVETEEVADLCFAHADAAVSHRYRDGLPGWLAGGNTDLASPGCEFDSVEYQVAYDTFKHVGVGHQYQVFRDVEAEADLLFKGCLTHQVGAGGNPFPEDKGYRIKAVHAPLHPRPFEEIFQEVE